MDESYLSLTDASSTSSKGNNDCSATKLNRFKTDNNISLQLRPQASKSTFYSKKKSLDYIPEFINKYEIIEQLGSGQQGKVFKISNKETHDIHVAKIMNLTDDETFLTYKTELSVLQTISHLNLPTYITHYSSPSQLIFVTKYHPSVPLNFYMNQDPCSLYFIKSVMFQLLKVLVYLHSKNIMHRDIKPSNILVSQVDLSPEKECVENSELEESATPTATAALQEEEHKNDEQAIENLNEDYFYKKAKKDLSFCNQKKNKSNKNEDKKSSRPDFVLKLIDFGVSKHYERGEKSFSPNGDPTIRAPEMAVEGVYDEKVDIWGIGLIFLGLSIGKEIGNYELMKYRKGIYPKILSEKGLDLLDKLLKIEPAERINGEEAVLHEWFKE